MAQKSGMCCSLSWINLVEIVAEDREFLLESFVRGPLVEGLFNVLAADVQHVLSVSTTSLLQAPSGLVLEVKPTRPRARVKLLEVVAVVDVGVGARLCEQTVGAAVVILHAACDLPVESRVLGDLRLGRRAKISANGDIHNNVGLVLDDFEALLDGRVEVHVPNGAAIHENVSIQMLGLEDSRDGA